MSGWFGIAEFIVIVGFVFVKLRLVVHVSQNVSSWFRMKHIKDLGPKIQAKEMEVVDKVKEEPRDEKMDSSRHHSEESVTMDAEELEEGEVVGEDDEGELEDGEIIDSDTNLVGKVT